MFPGWENFGGFLRHPQFVRELHHKVKRVALSAESKLAELVPRLREHFVQADVRNFAYEDLESAIKWAGSCGALNLPAQPERVQMSLANQNSSGAARGADGHSFWGSESSS
jgi:hypothetical protein